MLCVSIFYEFIILYSFQSSALGRYKLMGVMLGDERLDERKEWNGDKLIGALRAEG